MAPPRPVDVRALRDPADILYTVNGKGRTAAEVIGYCGGGERGEHMAARMIATGMIRELPGRDGEYATTGIGKWFYQFIESYN